MAPTSAPLIPAAQPPGETGAGALTQRNSLPSFQLGTPGFCHRSQKWNVSPGKGLGKVSWSTWFSGPCFKGNLTQNPNIQSKHQGAAHPSSAVCEKCPGSPFVRLGGGGEPGLLIATDLLNNTRQVNSWQSWEGPSNGRPRKSKRKQGPGGSRDENWSRNSTTPLFAEETEAWSGAEA